MHTIKDKTPEIAAVFELVVNHSSDWSGPVRVAWVPLQAGDEAEPKFQEVWVDGPMLLRGVAKVEAEKGPPPSTIPVRVLMRAIALAVDDRWAGLAVGALESISVAR